MSMHDDLRNAVLGAAVEPFTLSTSDDDCAAARRLVEQAQRSVIIYSRDGDALICNNEPFVNAIKALAIRSRNSSIRVLIRDSGRIVQSGHRLLPLAHHLSSKIQLRKPAEEFNDYHEAFIVVDDQGYLHRPIGDRPEGVAVFHGPKMARDLTAHFNKVWDRSEPDPNLRRLDL